MELKIKWMVLFVMLYPATLIAQDYDPSVSKAISLQATISSSFIFSGGSEFYLHGSAEKYLGNKISIAGSVYYYLGKISGRTIYDYNHNIFAGASLHHLRGSNDLFIGIEPGVAISKIFINDQKTITGEQSIDPLISLVSGYNFFVNKIFHFFAHTRYVAGKQNELRLSAGLGFHFNGQ